MSMSLKIRDKLKNWKWNDYLIVILFGVLLMIAAMPVSKDKESGSMVSDSIWTNETAGDEDVRLKNILSKIDGVGQVEVMIAPDNTGVVIVAEGAGDPVVEKNIYDSVQALFDVEMHKIKIVKMSE